MKILASLTILAFALFACSFNPSKYLNPAQFSTGEDENGNKQTIEASKTIATEKKTLPEFDQIESDFVGKIIFIQNKDAKSPEAKITGAENVIPIFELKVEKRTLHINGKRGFEIKGMSNSHISIEITGKELKGITNNGVGEITIDKLVADAFRMVSTGVGHSEIGSLVANNLFAKNDGVGSIEISNISTKDVSAENNGVGSIELSGTTGNASYANNGVGSIEASGLKAKNVKAFNNGVGSVNCHASDYAEYSKNGVGSIDISGNALKVKK